MVDIEFVPDSANLVRYCKPVQVINGRPSGAAFVRRPAEHDLSVNWLDKGAGTTEDERLKATVHMFRLDVRPSHWLALLSAGNVRAIYAIPPMDVVHQPEEENPAHCGITNVPDSRPDSPHSVSMALAAAVGRCVTRAELEAVGA
jgi:hypothetical protein